MLKRLHNLDWMRGCGAGWVVLCAVVLVLSGCGEDGGGEPADERTVLGQGVPQRIVSLAPSITETLFALGLGDRVVGVTKFCDYPAAALEKETVGGYYDANFELIMSLEPDLVVMMAVHESAATACRRLGLPFLTVENESTEKILETIERVGRRCGVAERAKHLSADLRERMAELSAGARVKVEDAPRVLVCIGREMGSAGIKDVSIAGQNTLYHELVTRLGGQNAYEGPPIQYPTVGREGLLRMRPDVILEMVSDLDRKPVTSAQVVAQWDELDLPAVKNDRVHVISEDYAVIPGPRFILLMEDIAEAIKSDDSGTQ